MNVYKYLHPDRVDVLQNGMLRFSQPAALNDPFEVRPNLELVRQDFASLRKSLAGAGSPPSDEDLKLVDDSVLEEFGQWNEKNTSNLGILSLSSNRNNHLMWAQIQPTIGRNAMIVNRLWTLLGRHGLVLYIIGGLLIAGFLHFRNSVSGQSEDRSLKQESFANEPLRINRFTSAGRSIGLGEKFSAPEDWLKTLSFDLTNLSDQSITHLELALEFPETGNTGQIMLYSAKFGDKTSTNAPVLIAGSSSGSVVLSEKEYLALKRFVESRQPLSTISQVIVRIQLVKFSDGSAWFAGNMYVPDKSSRNGMRRID
jgi:hypothetical protein